MNDAPVFVPCRKCMGVKHPILKNYLIVPKGFYRETVNGQHVLRECDCHKKYMQEVKNYDVFQRAGIPYRFRSYKVDKEYVGKDRKPIERLKTYVRRFDEPAFSSAVLYLKGPAGTQKSYTAQWLAGQIISLGKEVMYVSMRELMALLMENSEFEDRKKKDTGRFTYVERADLLVIDDAFDKERVTLWKTGYQHQFLDAFIRKRICSGQGLVIVSRFDPSEIVSQGFSGSIQDLISREVNLKKTLIEFNETYESQTLDIKGLFDDENNDN